VLYIGVEEEGIVKVKAEPENKFETIWVTGSNPDDRSYVSSDIEGIAYFRSDNKTYLLASSQGNFSYAIFELGNPDKYITSFTINDGKIDGAEETDGLEIYDGYVNETFPNGMLVVHDGYNFIGDSLLRQNFKYIALEKVKALLKE
ncbi:MAG: 3-phytase, partial [Marinilabiliales bacterium]